MRVARHAVAAEPLGLVVALLALLAPQQSAANCNVIPGATSEFRGAVGTVSRPFAIPGDEGEEIAIRVRPGVCDPSSSGFGDRGNAPGGEDDYFVSVLFEPPGAAPHHAVVLGTASNLATCQARIASAPALANGGTAECQAVPASGLCSGGGSACSTDSECAPGVCVAQPGAPDLSVRSECVGGSASAKRCAQNSDCPGATCEPAVLTFRFPDTDTRVGTGTDDLTLTGPATIVVTPVSDPLPFGLSSAALRCADPQRPASVVACIDELYARDGSCNTDPGEIDPTFGHFTALPPANDYQAMCTTVTQGSPCTGGQGELRFTVDHAGNVLIPMDYRGVLVVSDSIPVPRILSADSLIEAFTGGGATVKLPSDAFLSSYAPGGQRLPPLFTPLHAELAGPNPPLSLFGSVDAPVGVIRIHRNRCVGSPRADEPCTAASDCGGGSCEALYDFSDRLVLGVGPVLLAGSEFDADSQEPVALDGLLESPSMFAFVTSEAIDHVALNGDSDLTDSVLRLRDRRTGLVQKIGALASDGRAVTRVRDGAFRFPAVAVEGDVVAFLEPEPLEGNTDKNGNGEVVDTILRVYRMQSGSGAQELTSTPITADAAPLINGRSAVISNGKVFFRTSESEESPRVSTAESVVDSDPPAFPPITGGGDLAVVSGNGLHVAFISDQKNLAPNPNGSFFPDLYVRNRVRQRTFRVSQNLNAPASVSAISADGRFVAYEQSSQIWLHDRDADANGSFDPPGAVTTELVSCANGCSGANPAWSNGQVWTPKRVAISADGRFVAFISNATNMIVGHPFAEYGDRLYLRDRDPQVNQLVPAGLDAAGNPVIVSSLSGVCISSNGRFVAFLGGGLGFVVHDLDADGNGLAWYQEGAGGWPVGTPPGLFTTERADLTNDGGMPLSSGIAPPFGRCISDDGQIATFYSSSPDLVAGDTNGTWDVFVRDRVARTTTRLSVAPNGEQGNNQSDNPTISGDGRFVAFSTEASNLDDDGDSRTCLGGFQGNPCSSDGACGPGGRCATPRDVLVADLATGHLRLASTTGESCDSGVVADGGIAATYVPHPGTQADLRSPDPSSSSDRTGDFAPDDTVLRVIDTTGGSPGTPTDLCPAGAVSVAAGRAAFLRPEAAGLSTASACPQPSPDLNADGDVKDSVVQLWNGSSVLNLGRAATDVALSSTWLAALVSETDQGAGGTNLNAAPIGGDPGDADKNDRVLFVCAANDAAPGSCAGGGWVNTGLAADAVAVSGDAVVIALPETSQGGAQLNSDGDALDRVLRIYRAGTGAMIHVDQAVEDFVVDGNIVAFRTREASQGNADLNGDGDSNDDVLQAYDLVTGQLVSSGMAVTPCPVEACDPHFPYRVSGDVVTFVTLEAQQGADLNGDGDQTDLIKQVFNVRKALAAPPPLARGAFAAALPNALTPSGTGAVTVIASASTGVCTTSGAACGADSDCGGGRCFVPPGTCLEDLGSACNPRAPVGAANDDCPGDDFCVGTGTTTGTCHRSHGSCNRQGDCSIGTCTDAKADIQRLFAPIATDAMESGEVVVSAGRCVRMCTIPGDCEAGDGCDSASGTCTRVRGSCRTRDDCEGGLACTTALAGKNPLVTAAAADVDGDGLTDPIDNCPTHPNVNQADLDQDGIGDACDLWTCGDGVRDGTPGQAGIEECDDGNRIAGDGCDATCQLEAPDCGDGFDNDGDGLVDYGLAPTNDPGCSTSLTVRENPQCSNGVDDDFDGQVDFPADTKCKNVKDNDERTDPPCGLGAELVLALPILAALRRRTTRREQAQRQNPSPSV